MANLLAPSGLSSFLPKAPAAPAPASGFSYTPSTPQTTLQPAAAATPNLFGNTSGSTPAFTGNAFSAAAPTVAPAMPAANIRPPQQQAPVGGTPSPYAPSPISTLSTLGNAGSATLPNGTQVNIDSKGNITGSPSGFSINTDGSVPSSALTQNTTGGDTNNVYSQYLQQLSQAYQLPDSLVSSMKAYNQAKLQGAQISADFLTSPTFPGDTYSFAQGTAGRATALNALGQTGAAQNESVQEAIYQSRIDAAKSLVSGAAPTTVGIGAGLVSPANGQPVYQSPYLFRPSASSINSVAQQLLQSGAAPDYNTAYNMAQNIVTSTATGTPGAAGAATDVTQTPVYQNTTTLLSQGVPFDQVLSSLGRSTTAKAAAQQALNDFLGSNNNYNAAAAKAGYQFRQNAGAQTFVVNAKTAEDNIDKLIQLSDSFPRSKFPITNQAQLYALAQTGNQDAVNLYTYTTMLGDDLGKLLGSTGGSDYTTKLGQAMFNPNYNSKQLASVAKEVKGVIQDKVGYYNEQFSQGTSGAGGTAAPQVDMSAYAY